MEQLKFKRLDYTVKTSEEVEEIKKSEGILPTRATAGDAGLDLYSTRMTQETDNSGKLLIVYHTDIAVEIPEGYVGLLMMKSSVSKRSISLVNAVGVIDSGYRGELMGKFKVHTDAIPTVYAVGEAFAQLLVVPCSILEPVFTEELSDTERGSKGFGEADMPSVEEVKESENNETI